MQSDDDAGVFGPDTLRVFTRAQKLACDELEATTRLSLQDKEFVPDLILAQGRAGEHNLQQLVQGAVQIFMTRDATRS